MENLINKKVSAIADCGEYKNKKIEGILCYYDTTKQYLVKTYGMTISVKEETIKEI